MAVPSGVIPRRDPASPHEQPFSFIIHLTWQKFGNFNWKGQLVTVLAVILTMFWTLSYLYRWWFGIAVYYLELLYGLSGKARLIPGCFSAIQIQTEAAWGDFDNDDWFRRQRCLGKDDGLFYQGKIDFLIIESGWRLANPLRFPGGVIALGFVMFTIFYMFPWIYARKMEAEAKSISILSMVLDTIGQILRPIRSYIFTDGGITILAAFTLVFFILHPTYVFTVGLVVCITCILIFLRYVPRIFDEGGTISRDGELEQWNGAVKDHFRRKLERSFATAISISGIVCVFIFQRALFVWGVISIILFIIAQLTAMWTWKCRHGEICDCFTDYMPKTEVQANYMDLRETKALRTFREHADKRCYHLQDGRCACHNNCKRLEFDELVQRLVQSGAGTFPEFANLAQAVKWNWGTRLTSDSPALPLSPTYNPYNKGLRADPPTPLSVRPDPPLRYNRLRSGDGELIREIEKRRRDEETYHKTISALKEQLVYAKRVTDPERETMSQKLNLARLQVLEKDELIKKLVADNKRERDMRAIEEARLAEPCKDSEVCRREKDELYDKGREFKARLDLHDAWVQEAVKRLGWAEQIGPYADVKEYISQSVLFALNYARRQPQLLGPAVAAAANSQYIETLEAQHKEYRTYFGKLETEIYRLGGDPVKLRIGGGIFLARAFKTLLYLDARAVLFQHYERVYDKINELTGLIMSWNMPVLNWDTVIHDNGYPSQDDILFSKHDGPDVLAVRLVQSEIIRLCNHLTKLMHFIRVNAQLHLDKDQKEVAALAIWNNQNTGANQIVYDAYDMIEKLAVEYSKIRRLEGTTAQRRHPIYVEMFKAMELLKSVIESHDRIRINPVPVPTWDDVPPPKSFKRRTYDLLVNDLTKYEINALHGRIKQLLGYMTGLMMPGTDTGIKTIKDEWKVSDIERQFMHQSIIHITRAKKLVDFWNKSPKPGSITRLEFPNLSSSSSSSSDDDNGKKKDKNKDSSKHNHKDNNKSKLQSLRKDQKEKRDRLQQLQNLIRKNRRYCPNMNTSGNFTNRTKGTSEIDRLTAENPKLMEYIKILEKLCTDKYRLTLPKWPKKGGYI